MKKALKISVLTHDEIEHVEKFILILRNGSSETRTRLLATVDVFIKINQLTHNCAERDNETIH